MSDHEKRLTSPEAVALVRFAKGAFPAMQVDEYTPDAWAEILGPLRFEDCKEALVWLARRERFVSASDIYERVKAVRHTRVLAYGPAEPPPGLEGQAYYEWLTETNRRIGDGELIRPAGYLPRHEKGPWNHIPSEDIANLMPRPPSEENVAAARRAIHAAREALCTPHKLPADSCSLCAEAKRRAELQEQAEGDVA